MYNWTRSRQRGWRREGGRRPQTQEQEKRLGGGHRGLAGRQGRECATDVPPSPLDRAENVLSGQERPLLLTRHIHERGPPAPTEPVN